MRDSLIPPAQTRRPGYTPPRTPSVSAPDSHSSSDVRLVLIGAQKLVEERRVHHHGVLRLRGQQIHLARLGGAGAGVDGAVGCRKLDQSRHA